MKLLTATAAGSILLASATSFANPPISYDQVAAEYTNQHLDDADCHQGGIRVSGTKSFNNDFYALASLSDVSGSHSCGATNMVMGVGMHTRFGADSSLYGSLAYENTSVDYGRGDSGLVFAAGLRGFVSRELEARIQVAHHTAFDGDTELALGGNYWLNPNLAATGDVSLGSDVSGISLGIKFNY